MTEEEFQLRLAEPLTVGAASRIIEATNLALLSSTVAILALWRNEPERIESMIDVITRQVEVLASVQRDISGLPPAKDREDG